MNEQIEHNKKKLLDALTEYLGIVTEACRKTGIGRTTYYNYRNSDKKFKKLTDDIQEIQKDFVESMLIENIKSGKEASIIFYLKTKAKDRGYTEKFEVQHSGEMIPKELQGKTIEELEELEKQYEIDESND